jgi:hypothetical protein
MPTSLCSTTRCGPLPAPTPRVPCSSFVCRVVPAPSIPFLHPRQPSLSTRPSSLSHAPCVPLQYMLDPKVSGMVSRELDARSVVVFDEAHNIDNICVEAMSVSLDRHTLITAAKNLRKLEGCVKRFVCPACPSSRSLPLVGCLHRYHSFPTSPSPVLLSASCGSCACSA